MRNGDFVAVALLAPLLLLLLLPLPLPPLQPAAASRQARTPVSANARVLSGARLEPEGRRLSGLWIIFIAHPFT